MVPQRTMIGPVRRLTAFAALLCCALLLGSCGMYSVGRDIGPTNLALLIPGQTTLAEVQQRFGPPDTDSAASNGFQENTIRSVDPKFEFARVPGAFASMNYRYVRNLPPIAGSLRQARQLFCMFYEGVLVYYSLNSDFPEDSTDFDETATARLVKGSTTIDQALALLGRPAGMGVFPVARFPGQRKLMYHYSHSDLSTRKTVEKWALLLFDASGVLNDFRMAAGTRNMPPPPPVPASTYVPVYVPPTRK